MLIRGFNDDGSHLKEIAEKIHIPFRYYETIFMQILKVADTAEEFSDNVFELICKYTL
jgi:hypothetical protein